ncbi:two-component regulator propeller domain-containing protein [Marinoscillum sp. MHG1-6]|uniref:type IX secretion system anionic LPS delivery protein PorZ n=1 Tax=Marinoscillum sp. MHG1-6 TaxID=2959627 RepID=UPI002156F9C8|nr:two-component regulator propeller domain-containing protein [Marinoscillum sp. MHG1-6]
MKNWIISACFLGVILISNAQDIPIGQWRSHHSYRNARLLTASENKVFAATENGLFSYDLTDQSLRKITKNDGLSGAGITSMHYSPTGESLALGYASGIIDIIDDDGIHGVRDLKDLNDTTQKTIFDLTSYGDQILAATNFGILVISLGDMGIIDNYQSIGPDAADLPVYEITTHNDSLYAITSLGIQHGSLLENLLDFNNWQSVNTNEASNFKGLCSLGNAIYTIENDTSISQILGDTSVVIWSSSNPIIAIQDIQGTLHALLSNELISISSGIATPIKSFQTLASPNDMLFKNEIWIADGQWGLSNIGEVSLFPGGPLSDQIQRMRLIDNQIYGLYGPEAKEFTGTFDGMGYDIFSNGSWSTYEIVGFDNITDVAQFQGELIFSSAGKGLYFQNENVIRNSSNSILANSNTYPIPIISSLSAGNSLWVTSYDNTIPLIEYTADLDWRQFTSAELGTSFPVNSAISDFEVLWIYDQLGGLIAAYPEDAKYKSITTSEGLASNEVNSLAIDEDDELWVATTSGASYFPTASFVFEEFFQNGSALIFNEGEYYDQQNVYAVATDGGRRIWVSSEDGLSVFNNSLTRQEQFFTEDNSPLPSNHILQMEYNPANGEMFILTDQGLVSYRSSSSAGQKTHRSVNIFPNPVRPEYDGLVGISGLVTDANIKITDINGNLIAEIDANGGTASWDLRDYRGNKARTGIYLIFSSDAEGSETHIGKIAVVR